MSPFVRLAARRGSVDAYEYEYENEHKLTHLLLDTVPPLPVFLPLPPLVGGGPLTSGFAWFPLRCPPLYGSIYLLLCLLLTVSIIVAAVSGHEC